MSSEVSILKYVNQVESPNKPSSLSDQAGPRLISRLKAFHVNRCMLVAIEQALGSECANEQPSKFSDIRKESVMGLLL